MRSKLAPWPMVAAVDAGAVLHDGLRGDPASSHMVSSQGAFESAGVRCPNGQDVAVACHTNVQRGALKV